MAKQQTIWVLAPNFDIRPDGDLGLGSIVTSPSSHIPINPSSRIPPDQVLQTTEITNFNGEIAKRNKTKPGIWTAFLVNLGLGRNRHLSEDTTRCVYAFEKLVSTIFMPTHYYLEECFRSAEIQEFLQSRSWRSKKRPLYLVTGVKIAIGAPSVTTTKEGGISLKVSTSGFAGVDAGISVSRDFGRASTVTISPTDYIFAIRLHAIGFARIRELTDKEFTGGSLLSSVETGYSKDVGTAISLASTGTAPPSNSPTDRIEPPNLVRSIDPGEPSTSYLDSGVALSTTNIAFDLTDDPTLQTILVDDDTDGTIEVSGRFSRASQSSSGSSDPPSAPPSILSEPVEPPETDYADNDSISDSTHDIPYNYIKPEPTSDIPYNDPKLGPNPCIPYYNGINATLKLIASTDSEAKDPVPKPPRDTTDAGYPARKHFFPIGNEDQISARWEKLVETHIGPTGSKCRWVAVYCVRLGYDPIAEENPVVILVLVNPHSTTEEKGNSYIQELKDACKECHIDTSKIGIEVAEVFETPEIKSRADGRGVDHVLEGPFDRRVYIGASIGPHDDNSAGSFAAYLAANYRGNEILLALTCDHVCFDPERPPQETDSERAYKFEKTKTKHKYKINTPAKRDFEDTLATLEARIAAARQTIHKLQSRPLDLPRYEGTLIKNKEILARATAERDSLQNAKKVLGYVYGTGGRRQVDNVPMDWGTVRPPDNDVVWETKAELNMLPAIAFPTADMLPEINQRLSDGGKPLLEEELGLPLDLFPGSLPTQISVVRTDSPKPNEVFFKVGRTTGWTAGVYNSCSSVHFRPTERTTTHLIHGSMDRHDYNDYVYCLMWCFIGVAKRPFGASGDSGSLVFDREGKAIGLYCSGRNATGPLPDISNAIPLITVLRDIGEQLDVGEVRLANAPLAPARTS